MAPPKWCKEVMDCFVDECYNMVKDGCQPTNESVFLLGLKRTCKRTNAGLDELGSNTWVYFVNSVCSRAYCRMLFCKF